MEFLTHRLKSCLIEHITITVRVLPNEPLWLCFMGMESSLDPNVTCDVQKSKNILPEACSVLGPCGADGLSRETMKAWHHLWHSLGCHWKSNPMPHSTWLWYIHARRGKSDRSVVPKLPEITRNSLARHNEQSIGQLWFRYPEPIAEIFSNTHGKLWTRALMWLMLLLLLPRDYSRTRFLREQQGRECKALPIIATSTDYQWRLDVMHFSVLPTWLEMAMHWCRTVFSKSKLVSNPELESAPTTKLNLTQKKWAAFVIAHLHFDDYITSKINDVAH